MHTARGERIPCSGVLTGLCKAFPVSCSSHAVTGTLRGRAIRAHLRLGCGGLNATHATQLGHSTNAVATLQVEHLTGERDQLKHEVRRCRDYIERLREATGAGRKSIDSMASSLATGSLAEQAGSAAVRIGELEEQLKVRCASLPRVLRPMLGSCLASPCAHERSGLACSEQSMSTAPMILDQHHLHSAGRPSRLWLVPLQLTCLLCTCAEECFRAR